MEALGSILMIFGAQMAPKRVLKWCIFWCFFAAFFRTLFERLLGRIFVPKASIQVLFRCFLAKMAKKLKFVKTVKTLSKTYVFEGWRLSFWRLLGVCLLSFSLTRFQTQF